MRITATSSTILFFLFFIIAFTACNNKGPSVRKIQTGNPVSIAEKTIPLSGGEIVVDNPGDLLDGFTIDIPDGSYDEDRKFRISYASITQHDFDPGLKIVSPLINIDNGGGFSHSVMAVTIPIKILNGEFAMAYIYDEETGNLEGLPRIASDDKHITFATRHFTKIIVISFKETEADFYKTYETGFEPGVDDWQMGNPDHVYQAANGQCAGESMGMLWYYTEKRMKNKKTPQLNGLFDNDGKEKTPGFWQDDATALRFCALIHNKDFDLRFSLDNNIVKYVDKQDSATDREMMIQFAAAFRANDKPRPQFIKVSNDKNAHALVVYKMSEGTLYVADPNFPGSRVDAKGKKTGLGRKIIYDRKKERYEPYVSGNTTYNNFSYLGEFALVSFQYIDSLWRKAEDGTISQPEYKYKLGAVDRDGKTVPLVNGFKVPDDGMLKIQVESSDKMPEQLSFLAFHPNGNQIDLSRPLFPGKHLIGIEPTYYGNWLGFDRVEVEVGERKVVADQPINGDTVDLVVTLGQRVYDMDTASFSINPADNSFILISFDSDEFSNRSVIIETKNWKGVGYYNDANGSWIVQDKSAVKGTIYDAKKSAHLRIAQWSEGVLLGEFSFVGTDENGNKRNLAGKFRYPK